MKALNKILPGQKYVANFMDSPVRIGMVFCMDDKQFIPAVHFNDVHPEIDLGKWIDSGAKAELKFSEAKEVAVTFAGQASSQLGQSEVKIKFRKAKSVAGLIKDAAVDALRYENILPQLKQIWLDRGFVKYPFRYIFVYQVVTAASGTLIYSDAANNEVILKHKLDGPVKKFVDLGSGEFEYVSNSKRTLEIIRNVAHKPLFKAFYLRKNWQPEILG